MTQLDFHKLLDETYTHLWNGRSRLALTNAIKLFKNNQENSEASIILAWALLENGYPIKALEYADLSLQLHGSSTKSKMVRAQILLQLNILEGAKDDFSFSIKNQKRFLGRSYIQNAKAEASKGELLKAIKLVEKANLVDSHIKEEAKELNSLLLSALELRSGKEILNKKNLQTYFNKATSALKSRDVWFVNILSEQILENKKLSEFHSDAELINLEGLLHSYQFKPALIKAKELENRFRKNEQFKIIHKKLVKKKEAQESIAIELENEFSEAVKNTVDDEQKRPLQKNEKRTDHVCFSNKKIDVFSLKIFNQTEEEAKGKRTYYQQLNPNYLSKIGLEIIFENFEFDKSENEYSALAIWYLDDYEVCKNDFKLQVPKDWDTVIFTQTGIANWHNGQGKVDVFIENFKVCEKWFYLDSENITIEHAPQIEESSAPSDSAAPNREEEIENIIPEAPPARSIEELLEELNGYVGLNSIKYAVKEFIDYLKFQQERESKGLHRGKSFSINAIFKGNPGTGKTTIARLMGEIFHAMGIVEKGHVIEVDRSSLVGQYVGETAQKTDKLIKDAMGGILFIDEAYTLVKKGGSGQDFGQEAIDILLKRMEDKKGEFVVIVAGYPKEMQTFVESNPGLKSRFNHTFTFDDYTPDELLDIFSNAIKKEEYLIAEDATLELKKEFTRLYRKRDSSFGNARLVMQIFEKLKIKISKRLVKVAEKDKTKELLSTFIIEDVTNILKTKDDFVVQLPIDQEALSAALSELNNLFGLQSIKNEVADLVKLVKYFIKQGVNVKDKFGDHILFLGNPGTGKTTVARIISDIYSALGILPSGQLIEVDRSGLVGSHVGETAQKTTVMIGSAMGGTLFIDEAYALTSSNSSSDFGKEAVDTLLKRMEDDRGKFLVIAAGYTNEMKDFIASNPGMKSRFTKTFHFEDYTPEELLKIANFSINKLKLELTQEAEDALFKHFGILYSRRDKHFGNARIVRNLLEKIKKKQLLRIADEKNKEDKNKIILKDVEEFLEKEKVAQKFETKKDDSLKIILNNLNELVGHKKIKHQIQKQIKSLQVTKLRAERGLKFMNKNLNSLFIGNSGTSKSTVANYLGKIYKELNYLKSGHVVTVNGSELLVADSEHARSKVEAFVNKALDGVLFLEKLSPFFENDKLGELMLQNLSDLYDKHKGRLVIIISGNRDELEKFSVTNSLIKLKFNTLFVFDDYTPRELLQITTELARDNNYTLDEGALQIVLDLYLQSNKMDELNYQNIRLAEQVLFKAISNQEERISMLYNLKDEFLTTIIYDDVASIQIEDF
ncbi:MAG: AAA family ATPase [Melioribacteraceae bacterium]|nr:AAA family ATPase [Melioribacteraceae bacterium]